MCTSLVYRDAAGRAYFGRTLELTVDLPYRIAWLPAGFAMFSRIAGHQPLSFSTRYGVLAITMPARIPTKDDPIGPADLAVALPASSPVGRASPTWTASSSFYGPTMPATTRASTSLRSPELANRWFRRFSGLMAMRQTVQRR